MEFFSLDERHGCLRGTSRHPGGRDGHCTVNPGDPAGRSGRGAGRCGRAGDRGFTL